VHPEVVRNGAPRLRRFNLRTALRLGNFSVFPIQTPKRVKARAPTNKLGMHGAGTWPLDFPFFAGAKPAF
jgi:hypothetical protein